MMCVDSYEKLLQHLRLDKKEDLVDYFTNEISKDYNSVKDLIEPEILKQFLDKLISITIKFSGSKKVEFHWIRSQKKMLKK